jgi:hypothetical protein
MRGHWRRKNVAGDDGRALEAMGRCWRRWAATGGDKKPLEAIGGHWRQWEVI